MAAMNYRNFQKADWMDKLNASQSSRLAYGVDASFASGNKQQPTSDSTLPKDDTAKGNLMMIVGLAGIVALYLYLK